MASSFSRNVAPFVAAEIDSALKARCAGNIDLEFTHLENAHVIGQ